MFHLFYVHLIFFGLNHLIIQIIGGRVERLRCGGGSSLSGRSSWSSRSPTKLDVFHLSLMDNVVFVLCKFAIFWDESPENVINSYPKQQINKLPTIQ